MLVAAAAFALPIELWEGSEREASEFILPPLALDLKPRSRSIVVKTVYLISERKLRAPFLCTEVFWPPTWMDLAASELSDDGSDKEVGDRLVALHDGELPLKPILSIERATGAVRSRSQRKRAFRGLEVAMAMRKAVDPHGLRNLANHPQTRSRPAQGFVSGCAGPLGCRCPILSDSRFFFVVQRSARDRSDAAQGDGLQQVCPLPLPPKARGCRRTCFGGSHIFRDAEADRPCRHLKPPKQNEADACSGPLQGTWQQYGNNNQGN